MWWTYSYRLCRPALSWSSSLRRPFSFFALRALGMKIQDSGASNNALLALCMWRVGWKCLSSNFVPTPVCCNCGWPAQHQDTTTTNNCSCVLGRLGVCPQLDQICAVKHPLPSLQELVSGIWWDHQWGAQQTQSRKLCVTAEKHRNSLALKS